MEAKNEKRIERAELVLPCSDFEGTLEFFTGKLEFRVELIFPADDPAQAVISSHGLCLRLEKVSADPPSNKQITLRLYSSSPEKTGDGKTELTAPNGIRIELIDPHPPLQLPALKPAFVLNKFSGEAVWNTGRAGMQYRDLIPDRLGGRFIASHIRIPGSGPVPDYVHFHKIRFQMIYCYRGWAKLVYQDQGEPFLFQAGDCVLQPPEIRHRVLESGDDLEVIEISSPAEHETFADHQLNLPTADFNPERNFSGQKFVRFSPGERVWDKWRYPGFEYLDTGIGRATAGLAGVRIIRPAEKTDTGFRQHEAEFVFMFILEGTAKFRREENQTEILNPGDSLVIPSGFKYAFGECSTDLKVLEVTLPDLVKTEN